jgi:hypothetical protein
MRERAATQQFVPAARITVQLQQLVLTCKRKKRSGSEPERFKKTESTPMNSVSNTNDEFVNKRITSCQRQGIS